MVGNDVMLKVKRAGLITIICHLPNGNIIKREVRTVDEEMKVKDQEVLQSNGKKNGIPNRPTKISEKRNSNQHDL